MYKYSRLKVLGQGGFGAAILVNLKSDPKKQFVIKEVKVGHMSKKEQDDAKKEATFLKNLQHQNIVSYVESFVDKGKLCIVMGFADGGDLSQKVQEKKKSRGHFSEGEVMHLFVQMCLALKHVHDRRILHRDLKSQNIFLTKRGIVKVGDFGIAKSLAHTADFARTQIGTPYYLSPEICQDRPYNRKSDIWSLGCILYEMLALKVPFEAPDLPKLVQKIMYGKYAPPRNYSSEVMGLLEAMLRKDPKARPTINQILTTPIVKRYVQQLLSSTLEQRDFGASIARLARPTPAAPAPAPAPAAARGSPRIPRQAADQGSVGSRSRAGSGSRASELEIRRRHQMMAVQREKDRRRVEQAKAQMALDQARAAARENKEKEIAKLERQKWLEREKKRDKELSEQAEEKQQEAARLRAVKLAQREQQERAQMREAQQRRQKEWQERQAAAQRNRHVAEVDLLAQPGQAGRVGPAPSRGGGSRGRDKREDEMAAMRAKIWEENQRAKQRNRAAVEGQLDRGSAASAMRQEGDAGSARARLEARRDAAAARRQAQEDAMADARRREFFANRDAAMRNRARLDDRGRGDMQRRPSDTGSDVSEPMGGRRDSAASSKADAQADYEAKLAAARKQAFEERKQLEAKMRGAAQRASRHSPRLSREPSPDGHASPASRPSRGSSKADAQAAYEAQLAEARKQAFEERKRLQAKMGMAAQQMASGRSPHASPQASSGEDESSTPRARRASSKADEQAEREAQLAAARKQAFEERRRLQAKHGRGISQSSTEPEGTPPRPSAADERPLRPAGEKSPAQQLEQLSYEEQLAKARKEAFEERMALQRKMQAKAAAVVRKQRSPAKPTAQSDSADVYEDGDAPRDAVRGGLDTVQRRAHVRDRLAQRRAERAGKGRVQAPVEADPDATSASGVERAVEAAQEAAAAIAALGDIRRSRDGVSQEDAVEEVEEEICHEVDVEGLQDDLRQILDMPSVDGEGMDDDDDDAYEAGIDDWMTRRAGAQWTPIAEEGEVEPGATSSTVFDVSSLSSGAEDEAGDGSDEEFGGARESECYDDIPGEDEEGEPELLGETAGLKYPAPPSLRHDDSIMYDLERMRMYLEDYLGEDDFFESYIALETAVEEGCTDAEQLERLGEVLEPGVAEEFFPLIKRLLDEEMHAMDGNC